MIQALVVYLYVAMIAWVPLQEHSSFEAITTTHARYVDIATDIATVSLDADPVFAGRDGRQKTALLLAAIASYESHFAARVDDCSVTGDHGKALGIFQTHAPRAEVCSSRQAAVRVALRMVRESFAVCRRAPVLDRLGLFTDGPAILLEGRCREDWPRSRWRVGRAVRYGTAHPFLAPDPA